MILIPNKSVKSNKQVSIFFLKSLVVIHVHICPMPANAANQWNKTTKLYILDTLNTNCNVQTTQMTKFKS